jgi:bifunctional enzyme CysN/CysC
MATFNVPDSVLTFSTAGSVDDGKSTLIGRLLLDSGKLYSDQPTADLALITDGLRAEREQGITIDVAYRYFTSSRRRFILADAPGHEQYVKNMATAASRADLTLLVIDAKRGVSLQTKRHATIASLLGVPRLLVAVNKMDLVDYSEARFREVVEEFSDFAAKLEIKDIRFIPVSALDGDNVVGCSQGMPWFQGGSVLENLEEVYVAADRNLIDLRFPVQMVLESRRYAGTIASGILRKGDEVVALPGSQRAAVKAIYDPDGKELSEASAGDAIAVALSREIDCGRGSLLSRPNNVPHGTVSPQAMLIWFAETPSRASGYLMRHATRELPVQLTDIDYIVDVDTLHRKRAQHLGMNEIGRVSFVSSEKVFVDSYERNRASGNFILVDPHSGDTVAAGMFIKRERLSEETSAEPSPATIWLTGLSGAGKSSIAIELVELLRQRRLSVVHLDGDSVRAGLSRDLGFSAEDRSENIRRVAEVASLLNAQGHIVVCSFISPLKAQRQLARETIRSFFEVFVDVPLEECRKRDPKGMYKKAEQGEIPEFTGVSAPYEIPESPELILQPGKRTPAECALEILAKLRWRSQF